MHRNRVEHLLDGALAADLARLQRSVGHPLEDLEGVPVRGTGTRRSAWRRSVAARLDGHDERDRHRQPRFGAREWAVARPWIAARWFPLGVAAITPRRRDLPLPPAARVAAARGRDAAALHRPASARPGRSRSCSRSAAARRSTSCSRGPSRTSVCGLEGLRRGVGRLRGREPPGRRAAASRGSADVVTGADRDRARRGELDVPLPRRLRADVQPLPASRPRSRISRCSTRARARRQARAGRSGRWRSSPTVATHPYGALVLALAGAFVVPCARRERLRAARSGRSAPSACSGSRSGSPTSCSRAASTPASAARRQRGLDVVELRLAMRPETSPPASRSCRSCSWRQRPGWPCSARETRLLTACAARRPARGASRSRAAPARRRRAT